MQNNPFLNAPTSQANSMNTMTGAMPMPGSVTNGPSDNFQIDLTEVTENNAFSIPDGNYKVKCTDIEQSVSKSGNPMFVWSFQVSDGPHSGFSSKVFTAITPAAMWKVAETVEALGVGQTGSVVKFQRSDVVGKECGAFFEKTEYNGQNRSQISRVMTLKELAESKG